jgi:hypothetical protein
LTYCWVKLNKNDFFFKIKEKQSSVVLLRNPFIFHLNKSESVTDLVKKGKKNTLSRFPQPSQVTQQSHAQT